MAYNDNLSLLLCVCICLGSELEEYTPPSEEYFMCGLFQGPG